MDIEARTDHLERCREKARRRLSCRVPKCDACGEDEVVALSSIAAGFICYACDAEQRGRNETENHHMAGRAIDSEFVVRVPANEHRVLSVMQRAWLPNVTGNRRSSPLVRWAAILFGWLDVLHLILERLESLPEFLIALDQWLAATVGENWWHHFNRWSRKNEEPPDT